MREDCYGSPEVSLPLEEDESGIESDLHEVPLEGDEEGDEALWEVVLACKL